MTIFKNLLIKIVLVLLAFLPSIILYGFGSPYKTGFYCNDETIRKPNLGHEQISTLALVFLAIIPTIFIINFTNWFSHNRMKCNQTEHSALRLSLNDLFLLFFGLGLVMIIVDTSKFSIGRHRPHFYKSCEPRIPKYDSNNVKTLHECQTLGEESKFNYIVNYECTAKNLKYENDFHLSFMSGHAAVIMYSSIFVAIILSQRLRKHLETTIGRILVGFLIILQLDLGLFVSYSRVSDYRHHPLDVLTGVVTGSSIAVFVKFFIDGSRNCSEDDDLNTSTSKVQMKTIENNLSNLADMV